MGLRNITDTLRYARAGTADGGLPLGTQLSEMIRLRFGPFRLRPQEYYEQRLYRPEIPFEAKRAFVGSWAKSTIYSAGNHRWDAVADDKLLTYQFLDGLGLLYPKIVAIGHTHRTYPGVPTLDSPEALGAWLRDGCPFPLFAKPSDLALGMGCALIQGYDRGSDALRLSDGTAIGIEDYVRKMWTRSAGPLIFQELIIPHENLVRVIGPRAATMRIMVLLLPEGPRVHRIAFRIPVGSNMTDNYRSGKSGNMLGHVDPETGEVMTVHSGVGAAHRTIAQHPDTGAPFAGWHLPFWPETLNAVRIAAAGLAGIPVQGWDVALTPEGPSFVEVNHRGDFDLLQQAEGRGVADETFLSLLKA